MFLISQKYYYFTLDKFIRNIIMFLISQKYYYEFTFQPVYKKYYYDFTISKYYYDFTILTSL